MKVKFNEEEKRINSTYKGGHMLKLRANEFMLDYHLEVASIGTYVPRSTQLFNIYSHARGTILIVADKVEVAVLHVEKGSNFVPLKIHYSDEIKVFFRPHFRVGTLPYYYDREIEEVQVMVEIL